MALDGLIPCCFAIKAPVAQNESLVGSSSGQKLKYCLVMPMYPAAIDELPNASITCCLVVKISIRIVNHNLLKTVKYKVKANKHNCGMNISFADRLQRARTRAGLNQPELADAIKVSKAAISSLERGITKSPTPENLFAIADVLHVSARWLATGEGNMTDTNESVEKDIASERLLRLLKRLPESKRFEMIELAEEIAKIEERKAKLISREQKEE